MKNPDIEHYIVRDTQNPERIRINRKGEALFGPRVKRVGYDIKRIKSVKVLIRALKAAQPYALTALSDSIQEKVDLAVRTEITEFYQKMANIFDNRSDCNETNEGPQPRRALKATLHVV